MATLMIRPEHRILNVLQGSFSQSSNIFGDSGGLQCCANSLVFLCWTKLKRFSSLTLYDMNMILKCGDTIYKSIARNIGLYRLLSVDDIPPVVYIHSEAITVCKHNIYDGEIRNSVFVTPLTELTQNSPYNITGYLLFLNGMTFGLILDEISTQCYLFDSHSRDINGLPNANGRSIVITFFCLEDLQAFLFFVHCDFSQYESIYFQLQEIEIQFAAASKPKILKHVQNDRNRHNYQCNGGKRKESAKKAAKLSYQKDPGKKIDQVSKAYHQNPGPSIKRMKKAYDENPAPAICRAKQRYRNNPYPKIELAKKAYQNNPAPSIERAKQAYQNNPGRELERAKKAYQNNPSPAIERAKKAYQNNPGPTIRRAKKAYQNNPGPTIRRAKETYLQNSSLINEKLRMAYKHNSGPMRKRSAEHYRNNPGIKAEAKLKYHKTKSIDNFCHSIWEGPYYICVICNRTLYKKSVKIFDPEKYACLDIDIVTDVCSFDGNMYICITCDIKLKNKKLPCQAVANELEVNVLPSGFSDLRGLEKVLVSKRILFQKVIVIHGKGEFTKVKGTICNVPVESTDIANILPRHADSNGLLIVKLKRMLRFKGHYKCQSVRPDVIINFLNYLKENNFLYEDVVVCPENIDEQLTTLEDCSDDEVPSEPTTCNSSDIDSDNSISEDEDNLNSEFQTNSSDSVLVSTVPYLQERENLVIAPGEGQAPLSMMIDQYCEELSFPHLFPKGKYGRNYPRQVPISPAKYFNQRLLNFTQNFASDTEYIFYARALLERIHLQSSMNIAMQIVRTRTLTAGQLHENFNEFISSIASQDEAYKFMRSIRGSPAYWKLFLMEVLAMVKQLGLPSYFFTLSCADLKWDELIFIIARLHGQDLSREDIESMNYDQRTTWLNSNPVLLSRHFQYRTQLFFKNVLLNGALGTAEYYAYRVEFQQRGSPHIHGFLWIKDFPQLVESQTAEYLRYLDNIILTCLPDPSSEPELFHHVKMFQIHRHSRTCWKYKKNHCRFHFGKFFTSRSIIAFPLPTDMDEEERAEKLQWRQSILDKVKAYIDEELYPAKKNIIDPSAENFIQPKSIEEILNVLDISVDDYYHALSISRDHDFEIHFKRPPNSCFVNNYFADGLIAWQANIDIQPIFNHYKAVTYMCSYFSKCESECSLAMIQAVKESFEQRLPYYEQMKRIALAYSTKRECSIQEAVYHCLPELHLRRVFPAVAFVNSNLPEQRFRILKKKEEIDELPAESQDIFQRGDLQRYIARPDQTFKKGRFAVLDSFCYVEFLAHYDLITKKDCSDDYQPDLCPDDLFEANHPHPTYPKKISLMDSKETLRLRKVRKVLRYFVPKNRDRYPEKYAHHLLMLFYPFRDESELLSGNPPSYCAKLNDPDVISIVNQKRHDFEPYSEAVDEALLNYAANAMPSFDAEGQIENDETNAEFPFPDEEYDDHETSAAAASTATINPLVLPDDEINVKINSLNDDQRMVFDFVFTWARKSVQTNLSGTISRVEPFHIFLSGSGGCGKSHLIKTIYHAVSKTFLMYNDSDPLKNSVLLLAPTGVASINIEGTTIHSGLGIAPNRQMTGLSDKHRANLRNKLSNVKLLIIDEISMVSDTLLFQVSTRLSDIFGHTSYVPFGGLSVIVCGDLYQLPPVLGKPVYGAPKFSDCSMKPLLRQDLWKNFKYIELTKIMRQSDEEFIRLLNRVRVGAITEEDEQLLKERFITEEESYSMTDALHIFAENAPANRYNEEILESIDSQMYTIEAKDAIPNNLTIPPIKIAKAQNRRQQDCGGLAKSLKIKVGARVMLTANLDISDKLINGLMGNVHHIKTEYGSVKTIYIKFDDDQAGRNAMSKDQYASSNHCVPIGMCETDIRIEKNLPTSPVIKRTQFPLSLAWACTVHKVQGLSLSKAVISFRLEKQRFFNPGQIYVALSRVISLLGLHLTGEFDTKAIRANQSAAQEYMRLEETSKLTALPCLSTSPNSLTIVLSNVRSLRKHIDDIFSDKKLVDADILAFTETGLVSNHDTSDISRKKGDFNIKFNTVDQGECSLATFYSPSIVPIDHYAQPGLSLFKFRKPEFLDSPLSILLLYRKKTVPRNHFLEILQYFGNSDEPVDIIMGDFNINALSEDANEVKLILEGYEFIVCESTHLQGGLLDHVYVKKILLANLHPNVIVKSVFYSDHDAVKFQFSKYAVDFKIS